MTLEKFLQDHFGLKGDLFRENPRVDSDGVNHWFTMQGEEAYGRFTDCLYDFVKLCDEEYVDYLDIDQVIEDFDQFDTEPPEI